MALEISGYVDPGTYQGEVIVPGAVNIATTPALLGIVGPGSREKSVTNEAVQRGLVQADALTFRAPSGTGDAISAPSSGFQTLTDAGVTFSTQDIDSTITIRNATNPSNNGTFTITDRPSSTSVTYSNPAGVVEGSFPGTWSITPTTIIGGGSPKRTNRALQNTTLFRDNKAVSDSFLSFKRAYIETALAGPFALSETVNNVIVIEADGKKPLTIILTDDTGVTTVRGRQVTVNNKITLITAATLAQVVAAINEAFNPTDTTANNAVTALGYGPAYANIASVITGVGLRLTSPLTTPASDIRVSTPIVRSAVTTIFGAASILNRDAPSVLELKRVAYNATSIYTADYVNILDTADPLGFTDVLSVSRIGTSPGIGTFLESTDFALASDQVDWSLGAPASFQSTIAETFDLSTNDTIRLSVDGLPAIDIDLVALASPPIGYTANPGGTGGDAATAANVAGNINAVLAADVNYGSRYQAVASAVSLKIRLTSPTTGQASSIVISTPTTSPADDATSRVFGLGSTSLPSTSIGSGREPVPAATYFVTYAIDRPITDYNVQRRFLSEQQAAADLGPANASNPLMIAMKVAFRQGASSVVAIQVDDTSLPGSPTRQEFADAFAATTNSDLITDIAPLSTDLSVQLDLKDHVESECSPTRKHYRRGWYGMALNTDPGDKDTPDTFVYRAARTLQVAAESPGRGRMILVAPPQRQGVSINLPQTEGTERVTLDSTFLAVAIAAKKSSFKSPAATLASASVGGFNIDDIDLGSIWKPEERAIMASQGTMVVTFDAGQFKVLDPCTTEVGGGGLIAFSYPSTSSQKDNVVRKVDAALTANIVGIVPTDLADFIVDIKLFIADVINGEIGSGAIGPYTNANGTTRRLNPDTDIEVSQDPNNPTKFFFNYFFKLRYPALRLFGQFSVDDPFFVAAA